jgi:hypothetical protein
VKDEDIKATHQDAVPEARTTLPKEALPAATERKLPITRG